MSLIESVVQEKERVWAKHLAVAQQLEKLHAEFLELEATERVLRRIENAAPAVATGAAEPAAKRRGRPPRVASGSGGTNGHTKPKKAKDAPTLSDEVLNIVRHNASAGASGEEIAAALAERGVRYRNNHLTIALNRHQRANRLDFDQADKRWFVPVD